MFKFRLHNPLKLKYQRQWKKIRWWTLLKWLAIGGFSFTLLLFAWYAKDLPSPGKIRNRQAAESTKIFDRNGEPLFAVFGDQNRTSIKKEDIPESLKNATVAAEDRRFYEHHGFDFRGFIRGVILKPLTGQRAQGGSTITQQYVKNAILSSERTVDRKIKELILALEMELMFSKEDILTFYLNEIPYGSNNYGAEAAAKAFFKKDAKDLEIHESAMLAALPKAPTYYSPYGTHTDDLKTRRDFILDSMKELGMATQEDVDAAKSKEIKVEPRHDLINAPHFVFYIKEKLVEEYGEELVEEGGLKVTTTLDLEAQRHAQEAVSKNIESVKKMGGSNAAIVAVDPANGEILAMVGSADYFDTDNDGNVNVTVAQRQPGSSFKPIVYATGFKRHYNPATVLWDVPTDFGDYTPQNFDGEFRGPLTIRSALANSLNIPAVKMLGLVGLDEALKTAHSMGISTLNQPERYGLSLVLGGGEVKPLDMATAFSVFANGGTYRPAISVLKVEDANGKVLFEHHQGKGEKEVLDTNITYQITSILSDNEARTPVFGANSPLNIPGLPIAAKTGTTQEYRDAWTVGYSPLISVAVWAGNNDNSPMQRAGGTRAAAPIFHDFMIKFHSGKSTPQFSRPKTIQDVEVDKLSNKLPTNDSPEKITDIFAPWQVPKESDNVHVRVKVNKLNNKLATDLTPLGLIEEKTFTVIHSERPNDSRWEDPVLAWARDHGIEIGVPPTESDDMYDEEKLPRITITSLEEGQTISTPTTIETSTEAFYGISDVTLSINGDVFGTDQESPYQFDFDPSDFQTGEHVITATVTDVNGAKDQYSLTVVVLPDQNPPKPVTNITASAKNKSVTLGWTNPDDVDLDKIRIYVSQKPGQLGSLYPSQVAVEPSTTSSVTVMNLENDVTYYFTIRPVDTWGNELETTTYSIASTPSD